MGAWREDGALKSSLEGGIRQISVPGEAEMVRVLEGFAMSIWGRGMVPGSSWVWLSRSTAYKAGRVQVTQRIERDGGRVGYLPKCLSK